MISSANDWIGVALTIGACIVMLYLLGRKSPPLRIRADKVVVTISEMDFQIAYDRRVSPSVPWHSIQRVTWVKSSSGPTQDHIHYHVHHLEGDLNIPANATGAASFIDRLSAKAGFRTAAYAACLKSKSTNCYAVVYGERE